MEVEKPGDAKTIANFKFGAAVALLAVSVMALPAQAGIVTFLGGDNDVSSLSQMTNSVAAETAFSAAVPAANLITFETPVPGSVTLTGGSITDVSGCGSLCGINTTPGGQNFYSLFGGSATITFATPINAFGMYITGVQTDVVTGEMLTFNDGSSEFINTPSSTSGGGAFIGFTDFGQSITSVTYDAVNDIVALDDIQYASANSVTPVPEPLTLSLFGAGFAGAVAMRRRKKAKQV